MGYILEKDSLQSKPSRFFFSICLGEDSEFGEGRSEKNESAHKHVTFGDIKSYLGILSWILSYYPTWIFTGDFTGDSSIVLDFFCVAAS